MSILKLTDLNGKPCRIDTSLMVKAVRLQTGYFRLVTKKMFQKAGEPPHVEHEIHDILESPEDILLKVKECEQESRIDLSGIKYAIQRAPLEGQEYITLHQSDGKVFMLDLRFFRALKEAEKGRTLIETVREVKRGGEPLHIDIQQTVVTERVKEIAKRIQQNKAFAGLPNVRYALQEVAYGH